MHKGDRPIAFRTLRQIIGGFNYDFAAVASSSVEVVHVEVQKPTFLRREAR